MTTMLLGEVGAVSAREQQSRPHSKLKTTLNAIPPDEWRQLLWVNAEVRMEVDIERGHSREANDAAITRVISREDGNRWFDGGAKHEKAVHHEPCAQPRMTMHAPMPVIQQR